MLGTVTSERKLMEKLNKIKIKSNKKVAKIKDDFANMQKAKAEALKKTEDLKKYSDSNLAKIERIIIKSKDLAPESIQRLNVEIEAAKNSSNQKYDKLKGKISQAILPEFPDI